MYILVFILHLYYKLDYIKMAWGGLKEQQREQEAGNSNVKDWQDKALKTTEETMCKYWKKHSNLLSHSAISVAAFNNTNDILELDFNHHHHKLIHTPVATLDTEDGWAAELCYYLSEQPMDVMKDTDVVESWSIRFYFILLLSWQNFTNGWHRNMPVTTPPLHILQRMYVQS